MNAQKEYFIYLLSCFLSGKAPKGREADWKEIFRLADIHDVGAIIAGEIKLLPDEYKPQGELRSHFNQTIGVAVREYDIKINALSKIKSFFDENSIEYLFVKWAVINDNYPIPEFRTSGDIDVIIKNEKFDDTVKLIFDKRLKVINRSSDVIAVSADGVEVEIHRNADVKSNYFDDAFALCDIKENSLYSLNEYDHLLYIICHLAKHLAYRGAGIRMLCDIDVMIRNINNFDQDKLINMCDAAGIRKTGEALLSLCFHWFETPVKPYIDFNEDNKLLTAFENVIIDGGSFGYETNSIPARYINNSLSPNENRLKILLKMAFPSREYLKRCYPYYERHSALYLAARINRLADGLFKKRKRAINAVNQLKGEGVSSYQLELLNELDIKYN